MIVPFVYSHVEGFEPQAHQGMITKYFADESYIGMLSEVGHAWSYIHKGKVIAMGGILSFHEHIGMVWAILGVNSQKHLFGITKSVLLFLECSDYRRLETTVKHNFVEGHRWANMLGFVNETPDGMKNYSPDGQTYDLYSRCK